MDIQIQNIKFQFKNIETQFYNIEMPKQNMGMTNFKNQIKNMGIQIINMGIQMIKIGLPKPNKEIDDYNIKTEIQNIILQLQKIIMLMNNNNNIFGALIIDNKFGKPIKNNIFIQDKNNFNNEINTKKVCFKTLEGDKKIFTLDSETTVGDMLKLYLKEINRLDLINSQKKILFLFNSYSLSFDDKTKIGKFFKGILKPSIIVHEDNIISG